MTRSNLIVRFQWFWSFGECRAPRHCHCSQVHSGPEWKHLIYGLDRTNCIRMLNWIVWIRTVWLNWIAKIEMFLTIKLYLYLKSVLMLKWILWNGTVFDIKTELTLNWIVLCRTVLTFICVSIKYVLMINWITWFRIVLTIKLCTHGKLNCMK